jgi:hypothetical protein
MLRIFFKTQLATPSSSWGDQTLLPFYSNDFQNVFLPTRSVSDSTPRVVLLEDVFSVFFVHGFSNSER